MNNYKITDIHNTESFSRKESKKRSKLKIFILILLIFVISWVFFKYFQSQKSHRDLDLISQELMQQNTQLRAFVFGACQINGFSKDYYFVEGQNCQSFFSELFLEDNQENNIESSFINLIDVFVVNPNQNKDLIKEILLINDYSEGKVSITDSQKDIWAEFQTVIEKNEIKSYLSDFGLEIQLLKDGSYQILDQENKTIEISFDKNKKIILAELIDGDTLRLDNLNVIESQAQYVLEEFSDFDLENIANISEDELDNQRFKNYLILGKNDKNVDTIIFVAVDILQEKVTLVSLPRDLWVDKRKINSYYYYLGIDGFVKKIESVTGQKIENYVLIDMYAFPEVVDKLGGIEFTFDYPLIDPTYRTVDNGVEGTLYFPAGTVTLNGIQALRVARSRHTSSDFGRADRQQKILASLNNKIKDSSKTELSKLIPVMLKKVDTNLNMVELLPLILKFKDYEIRSGNVISTGNILTSEYYEYDENNRAYILIPKDEDWSLIKKYIINAIYAN